MKRIFTIILISSLVNGTFSQIPQEPSGRRLRVIMNDKYPHKNIIVGATTGSWAFETNTGVIMDREFNYVTPENDFKQSRIHRDNSSTWYWRDSDAWINHIVENEQILRIHGPIGPQCSKWAKDDKRTVAELEKNMTDFMKALCKRYNGKPGVVYLDVVNETVIKGKWHKNKKGYAWENPWYKIGLDTDKNKTPVYLKKAFEIANKYAPDMKFVFNHHEHPEITGSWNLIKETVIYLRNLGLRVDGIGWQAHVDAGWDTPVNLDKLRELIEWAHSNQLEFHVTEASVYLKNGNSKENLEMQAKTYSAILQMLVEKSSEGKVGWSTWHIDDGHGWKKQMHPSLFDSDYNAKPAYYAIQKVLEGIFE